MAVRCEAALELLLFRLEGRDLNWALTGSMGSALQGVPGQVGDMTRTRSAFLNHARHANPGPSWAGVDD